MLNRYGSLNGQIFWLISNDRFMWSRARTNETVLMCVMLRFEYRHA